MNWIEPVAPVHADYPHVQFKEATPVQVLEDRLERICTVEREGTIDWWLGTKDSRP